MMPRRAEMTSPATGRGTSLREMGKTVGKNDPVRLVVLRPRRILIARSPTLSANTRGISVRVFPPPGTIARWRQAVRGRTAAWISSCGVQGRVRRY